MRANPTRVALMHLEAEDAVRLVDSTEKNLAAVGKWLGELRTQGDLLNRLIARGESRRLGRTSAIGIKSVSWDGNRVSARIAGTSGDYDTRITLFPKAGHHCTCPDWERNGQKVGPCKHVLRLGEYWRDERLVPAIDTADNALMGILEHSEL